MSPPTFSPMCYIYDTDSTYSVTATGHLLRVNVGSDYQERYTFDGLYRTTSVIRTIGSRTYTTSYNSYNTAGQLVQMTYSSSQALYFRHDSSGRLAGLTNFASGGSGTSWLSSLSYNVAGQVTGDMMGNGVTEQFGYDAARLQMTSQKAGTVSPYTNRMNLTYSYSASAGQMGVNTTAGNAGQLMGIVPDANNNPSTINGTTESASYTYDNYSRLLTSNQTSNSTTTQRRFAYDRWGNRTGVWDATSGGTQIQSVTLVTNSSIPNNRISSVTSGGGTTSYSYDANGNVTNDGAHSYTYDSENRLVSVDGGTTATYAYDQENQRYKATVGSSVTHYIWRNGQVLAEHNGSTGAVLVDYLYAGARLIARIASGTTTYLLSDRLSARLTLSTSGAVVGRQGHLPFGEDFAESGTQQKQHFTSYERDSQSGTDYAMNRHYSSGVGRFQSADPFQASAGADAPQSWNRYSYVMNAPADGIDREGLNVEPELPPDPCSGEPWIPPPPKRCRVSLGVRGSDLSGTYHRGGDFSSHNTIGPAENPVRDGFWGYTYEFHVKLPDDDRDQSHWTASRIVVRRGSVFISYNGGLYEISKQKGPEDDGPGASNEDWTTRGRLYVVDDPDIQKVDRDPNRNQQDVIKGEVIWTFAFRVTNSVDHRRDCWALMTLRLVIENQKPTWRVTFKEFQE